MKRESINYQINMKKIILLLFFINALYSFAQSNILSTNNCVITEFTDTEQFTDLYDWFYKINCFNESFNEFNKVDSAILLFKFNTHGRYSGRGTFVDLSKNITKKICGNEDTDHIQKNLDREVLIKNINLLPNKNYIESCENNELEDYLFFIIKLDGCIRVRYLILGKVNFSYSTNDTIYIKDLISKMYGHIYK